MFDRFRRKPKPQEIVRAAAISVIKDTSYPGANTDLALQYARRQRKFLDQFDDNSTILKVKAAKQEWQQAIDDLEAGGHNTLIKDQEDWALQEKFRMIADRQKPTPERASRKFWTRGKK